MNIPLPPDEAGRLQEVRRFRIMDTAPEAAFERLTRLASRLFNVPIAIIKLIDEDRQWLKSSYGLDFLPPGRAETLGAQAILTDEVLVAPDAAQDARFADNPLVTGETAIRFYAAAPLHTADGFNVGVFAVMDTVPREMSESEVSALADLAALAVEKMELRLLPGGLSESGSERRDEDLLSEQSEEHFRALIENAADIIAVVGADGTMRYNSPSIESLLGYAPEELNGKNAFDLIHPDDARSAGEALTHAIQAPGGTFPMEYRFRHRDGSWRVLKSVGKTLPGGSLGQGVLLSSRDVTERKQAEADRAQLAAIVESSEDAIIGKALDGTVLAWNAAARRIYGYAAEEVLGRSIGMLVPPGRPDEIADILQRVGRGELIEHMETRRVRRDGSVIDVSLTISPIRDLTGRVTGLSTIAREITERKASDIALQEARDQLQVVLDTIPGGVSWIDSDLQYHGVNRYLAETFQRPAEAFIGQHIGFMDVSPGYAELVRDFMAGPQQQTSFEFAVDWNNSTRTMLMMARKYEAGRAVFVGTDITARKQAEAALQKSHDELEVRVAARTAELADVIESLRAEIAERERAETALRASEAQYRRLLDLLPAGAYTCDADGLITYFNEQAVQLWGRAPKLSDTVDRFCGSFKLYAVDGSPLAHDDCWMARAIKTGQEHSGYEIIIERPDGERVTALAHANPILDESGAVVGAVNILLDITARRQAQEALRQSEVQFRSVTEAIPQQVWTARPDGALDYVNQRVVEHFGRSFDEMIGWNWTDMVHPDDVPQTLARWRQSLETGELYEVEFRLKRASDGVYRWNIGRALPLRDGEGRIVKWFGTNTDIAERKAAEESLRESEARYRSIVNTSQEGIWLLDAGANTSFVNERMAAMLGYEPEEMMERSMYDFMDEAARLEAQRNVERRQQNVNEQHDFRFQRKDGSFLWTIVSASALANETGAYSGTLGMVTDITARKEAEDALRESEARKGAILETALDCIITIDHEGKVLEWNPAAEETFGFSRAQAVGQLMAELIVPEALRERHYQGLARYLATGEGPVLGNRIEVPALRADGSEILVELSITAIASAGAPAFTAYLRDITARKQTDEALNAAKEEAERANRAKSEFLSRMSHELRTPLNAILGFGQLLEMDELDAEQSQGVQQILKGGRHLLELINEVLDIARIESEQPLLEMERVPAVEVLPGALELVRPLALARDITLQGDWSAAEGLCVLADKRRLNQVLLNLLSNAVKYNRAGGTATLSAAPTGAARLSITISDTGMGIAPQEMERLWTPFDRLGAERSGIEGTGLGLALTRRLVEAMSGDITVQSTLGEGSAFVVELPLAQNGHEADNARQVRDDALSPAPSANSGETQALVLYIEDNLSNFSLMQNILRHRSEIKLLAAMRGRLGVELAAKHRPDLILLDVHLPDINGDEVLRLLRAEPITRDIPVIVVSADATPGQIERLLQAGANDYLTKPLDVKLFLTTLDENLKR